jgi:hypothetical protein
MTPGRTLGHRRHHIEHIWQHTKHGRLANLAPEDAAELRAALVKKLERLHRRPKLLASFIRHAKVPIGLQP